MIVKNEQQDILNCLNSIKDYVDQIIIADTGSTDRTVELIYNFFERYQGLKKIFSSNVGMENDKIVSFADARNNLLQYVDPQIDYLFSLDADDTVINPEQLQQALINNPDAVSVVMYGQDKLHRFNICRIWKNNLGIKWSGAVHEYLVLPDNCSQVQSTLEVSHRYGDAPLQENGTERNLRIMKKEIEEGRAGSRTYFYYANQLRESGKYLEAIEYYDKYLTISFYNDEKALAYLYRARSYRLLKEYTTAVKACFEGLAFDTRWCEIWMELAFNYYELKQWKKCIAICDIACTVPVPNTNLFVEVDKYTTQPHITRKFAQDHLDK